MLRQGMIFLVVVALLAGCAQKQAPVEAPVSAPVVEVAPAPKGPVAVVSPGADEYEKGQVKLGQGLYLEAVSRLRRAVELDKYHAEAWNDLSFALLRVDGVNAQPATPGVPGKYREAVAAAQAATALKSGWGHTLYNLGLAHLANAQYAEAVAPLTESAKVQGSRPEPWTALGLAYLGTGAREKALSACEQAGDYPLAQQCLRLAGKGLTRLPEAEAAVGAYKYAPGTGFTPQPGMQSQQQRISPPVTCGNQYPDGLRELQLGCRGDVWTYTWSFTMPQAGSTPKGIRVGSPWAEVLKAYGDTTHRDARGLHYAVADVIMVIEGADHQTEVTAISFDRTHPYWLIGALMKQ